MRFNFPRHARGETDYRTGSTEPARIMKGGRMSNDDTTRDELVAMRERLAAKRAHDVITLLSERRELQGVHALADLVGESTLWCA